MTDTAASPRKDAPQDKASPGQPPDAQADSGAPKPRVKPPSDEPELALEPDVPSDGRDEVGDAMIRDLPRRPELGEPPSQPKAPR